MSGAIFNADITYGFIVCMKNSVDPDQMASDLDVTFFSWVKTFMIIPELTILRLTFQVNHKILNLF